MRPYLREPTNNVPRQCSSKQNASVLWLIVYLSATFYQKHCATVAPARHHWLVVAFGPCSDTDWDAQMLQLAVGLSLTTTSNSGTTYPSCLCDVPPALPPSRCTPSPLSPPSLPNPEQWCATVRLGLTTGTTSITIFARLLQVCDLFHFISSMHFTFKNVCPKIPCAH